MDRKTADEILEMITETLAEADGEFIADIASQVLSGQVIHDEYNENYMVLD
jgi:hypothetical protein